MSETEADLEILKGRVLIKKNDTEILKGGGGCTNQKITDYQSKNKRIIYKNKSKGGRGGMPMPPPPGSALEGQEYFLSSEIKSIHKRFRNCAASCKSIEDVPGYWSRASLLRKIERARSLPLVKLMIIFPSFFSSKSQLSSIEKQLSLFFCSLKSICYKNSKY